MSRGRRTLRGLGRGLRWVGLSGCCWATLVGSAVHAAPPDPLAPPSSGEGDPPFLPTDGAGVQRPGSKAPSSPLLPSQGGAPVLPGQGSNSPPPPPPTQSWRPPATEFYDPDAPPDPAIPPDPEAWRPVPGIPGSGMPRDPGVAAPSRLGAPAPVRARNEAESQALDELERLTYRYREAADATEESLALLLALEAEEGKAALSKRYGEQIDLHAAKARVLRAKAITRYREFLELHPDDPAWTPEIQFRLAELHYEVANERFRRKEEAWETEIAALEARRQAGEEVGDAPPPPKVDYAESIDLFRKVSADFPRFAHNDAARYMMGILLYEQEDFDGGRQALLALTCADRFDVPDADGANVRPSTEIKQSDYEGCTPSDPDSKFLAESWLRVGEIHYDVDELRPALQAYTEASRDPEDRYYHAALIRLAWTLYLRREFAKAVERFDEFILFAEKVKGTEEGQGAAEYRDEAIRYLAKCYYEEDWDRDGDPDPLHGIRRLDADYKDRWGEPHVPEIYTALGQVWAEADDLLLAVNLWEQVLSRWPNSPKAPQLQMRLYETYRQLQEEGKARTARDALATNYLRGTPWFYANEDDPATIESAMALVEDALVAVAVDHHRQAQIMRSEGDPAAAGEYEIAARAYAAYLERFPETESSYEYRFQYADALYYSDDYLGAATQFAIVRDSNLDNRLQGDASASVLASLESYLEQEEDKGRFVMPEMPKQGAEGPFDPVELPAVIAALQDAYDRHVAIRPDDEEAGAFRFKSAALSQRYYRFDEAEKRFLTVLERHCEENVAINAGYAIIDGHVVRGDLAGTREWTEKLAALGCGSGEEGAKFAGELKTIGNAVRFQEASQLMEEGKFEAAADRYVALVDEAPDDPNADRALNNAAVAYEQIGRFGSASKTYERIYSDYPDSEFADDALLRTGLNHARFFEFEEAVTSYLRLAEDPRYEDSEFRLRALQNAAGLLEGLQQYPRAAELTRAFADKTENEQEKAQALLDAARILGKTKDQKATIAAYKAYLSAYEGDPAQSKNVVEAHLRVGIAYASLGQRKLAEGEYRQAVQVFQDRGLAAASDAADLASEAQFRLAEYSLADVLAVTLTGTGRKFEKQAKQLFDRVVIAAAEYDAVFPYRRIEWVLASMYRRGYAFETVAQKVRSAPVPPQLKEGTESWYAYKELVDQQMAAFEEKAVMLYEETVKRSREFRISNEWTQRAFERLNVYKPEEYPLLRPAAVQLEVEDRR